MLANLLYLIALTLLSPWILYRSVRHGRYRRGGRQKLFGLSASQAQALIGHEGLRSAPGGLPQGSSAFPAKESQPVGSCIWIHAVSVGEVNLLGGVISRLCESHPDLPVVVSTSTDTGYDLAIKRFGEHRVFFCPLDFTWAVKRTLKHLDPALLVLAELELWPNLIRCTRKRQCDVVVINGRLSERSAAGYQRFSKLTRPIFAALSRVECQDRDSAVRFEQCGTPAVRISTSGSLKFDDAPESRNCAEVAERQRWAGVGEKHSVWIVGSTQEGEELMALDVYLRMRETHQDLRLILVPRHPERFDRVADLIRSKGLKSRRRRDPDASDSSAWDADTVILIDTIGELRAWWGVGRIATVGGSFGDRGGQNMLEPAGYGLAVSFGPDTRNFRDIAGRLLDANAAIRVQDATELEAFVARCLADRPWCDSIGRAAQSVVQSHRGSTARVMAGVETLLPSSPHRNAA